MYVLVEIKGKQYKAQKGAVLKVDKLESAEGEAVEFDKVMMVHGDDVKIGSPYLAGVTVKGTVESQKKDKKVIIFKFKRRKNYRRKQGHRQTYSYVKVEDIVGA
ncbi:MAG: 50S ribosomal protein L21 [Spirochaetales bacterium]|nr:MAG: 50S ribosomal protein L21 [Spirochaetales bacterium]